MIEKIRILFVEDEASLAQVVKDSLEQKDYSVTHAEDGLKGYSKFASGKFSLCIIDVMLPQLDGFALAKQIRISNPDLPILFLTARTGTKDVIEGYHSGGNDYLKKPFSLEELFLRVEELLKRVHPKKQAHETVAIGSYFFMPNRQTLRRGDGPEVKLSHRETQLLQLLYNDRNNLLDRKKALITLWGDDSYYNGRTMDVFISKLRRHLRHDATISIINMRGAGYKLIC
jgi:two-component system, OmpR family, response regulator TrcR